MKKHVCNEKYCDKCIKRDRAAQWLIKNKQHKLQLDRKIETVFRNAKYAAKSRDLKWDLSFEKFIEIRSGGCFYFSNHIMPETGTGLDRIDNNFGYVEDNVIGCCTACNQGRNKNFTVDEWKIAINSVENYRKSKTA